MDFRLLGPLEVHAEGASLPLGGRKQRGILAALLVSANTVVTTDRLIDDLWGEQPPRTAQSYVHNCISRLRATIGHDVIETHLPGYLLRADPDEIDASRFERAVAAARDLEPPERVATLTEALALWRGPALAEFAFEPFARVEIARLDELRIGAIEDRLEAELELGRDDSLLAELDALAARNPTRERLRYLQLLALYRAGRQRDALDAYQEFRHELVEQFGLEPGDRLRALERMILAHDPALAPTALPAAAEPTHRHVVLAVRPVPEAAALVVERHGGAVVRRTDDELVVTFGGAHSRDDDALRALRTAAELRRLPGRAACIAIDRVADADLDRRLLDASAPGDVVVGAGVLSLVAHAVDVVAQPGGRYRVLRFDAEAESVPRRFDVPLAGRDDELTRLEHAVDEVTAGRFAQRLVVAGDAGIGKTRLARELASRLARRATVIAARCGGIGDGRDPVRDLVAQLGPPHAVLGHEPDAKQVLAKLPGPARADRSEEQWALRRLFEAAARGRPLVVVLDDLQWADATVLDLVDYLVGWARAPLLVLCLGRPEALAARPEWQVEAIELGPLADEDAATLAGALAQGGDTTSAVRAAEGNPLFLEQLLAAAAEEDGGAVPPTIEMLIAGRIQRLPPLEQRVLARASVAGTEFWRAAVETASAPSERESVGGALMSLVRKRLLHPARAPVEGEDGFRFHHTLIREVVYASVDDDAKAAWHEAVARSLDSGDVVLRGHHLELAARHGAPVAAEAARTLGAAGLHALRRFDIALATDLLERAAALTPEGNDKRELEWAYATARKFGGDAERADELLEHVADDAARNDDRVNERRARIERVWRQLVRGELSVREALDLLERAIPTLAKAGDDFSAGRAWDLRGAIDAVYRLRTGAAEESERRAHAHYERAGFVSGAYAVRLAGAAYRGPLPVDAAIARCEELLAAESPVWGSFVQPFLAALHAMGGRIDTARALLEEARVARTEFAGSGPLATSWAALAAHAELHSGEPKRAETNLVEAVATLRAYGDQEWLATNTALLADARLRLGDSAAALADAKEALAQAPPEHLTSRSIAGRVRALALARLGDTDAALTAIHACVDALVDTDCLDEQAETHAAHAAVLELAGETEAAVEQRALAHAAYAAKGNLAGIASLSRES